MFKLNSCPKKYTKDLDKALSPEETVANISQLLQRHGQEILLELKRIDTGRLDIPVYLSLCGTKARQIMPTRKQMGKGASPVQAQASALMELVERFSYFSFVNTPANFHQLTFSEAQKKFGSKLIPLREILFSVQENLSEKEGLEILDLVRWKFCLALDVPEEEEVYLPFDWFKKLNEFNGCSAGNTYEESLLQGACELIERHVCALIDRQKLITPTIDPASFKDPVLKELYAKFQRQNIKVWLKDFSLGFPAPTVGALAYDPVTFPHLSEIVFTAGTASTPTKAAIRALTEIAQLAGDFETNSNYEASGLSKFKSLEEIDWIIQGEKVDLNSLPTLEDQDIYVELKKLCERLKEQGYTLYSIDTAHPDLKVPTNYNIIPGFEFRERTPHASLGLFVGRILAEEEEPLLAIEKIETLAAIYPQGYFIPFFKGLIQLRLENLEKALELFEQSIPLQPDAEEKALALFYLAYTLSLKEEWAKLVPYLDEAIELSPEVKEYYNLRGVSYFKQAKYDLALLDFQSALDLDSGSAIDLANLGICYKRLGNEKNAAYFLKEALKLEPHLEFARKELADLE
ncbi:MAG: hypothetical protein XD41_1385 [Desulfonauticus sp. 38_4375]|nr:MAG: hypothetical protein XD41_1385 [Desulfonauticus sp. 38_4375]